MQNINFLKQEKAELIARGEALLDKADAEHRDLSITENEEYKQITVGLQRLNLKLAANDPTFSDQPVGALRDLDDSLGQPTARRVVSSGNSPALAMFGETRREQEKAAYGSGMWIAAQLYGNERAQTWCSDNGYKVYAAASEGVATQGGNLVPVELESSVIKLMNEYGVARRECRIRPMGSDRREIPKRQGGLTASYIGEGQEGSESDSEWSLVGLTAKKMMILSRMSSELNEDSVIDLAADYAEEAAQAFAQKEDNSLFNGDGTSTYGGIEGIRAKLLNGTKAGAVLAASGVDTFAEVTTAELNAMMAALPAYAARNAKWYCSRKGYVLVFQRLIEAAGGITASDLVAGPIRRGYMGYPVIETEAMPTSAGDLSGEIMLVFGDLRKGVELGDRRGVRVALSEHAHWTTDQIGVRGTMRHDINFHDDGDATTAGAVVGLKGN
ncbi:MAG: phage major capsid protein [Gallionella sp.]